MNKWRKNRFLNLQAILLIAEKRARWGIGVVAFFIALFIHLAFLFGFRIIPPATPNWSSTPSLMWISLPKQMHVNIKSNIYWRVDIVGKLAKIIETDNIEAFNLKKIKGTDNISEFNLTIINNEVKHVPMRPAIFNFILKLPDKNITFSLMQSSGSSEFDSAAATFIDTCLIKLLPDTRKLKDADISDELNSVITISYKTEILK